MHCNALQLGYTNMHLDSVLYLVNMHYRMKKRRRVYGLIKSKAKRRRESRMLFEVGKDQKESQKAVTARYGS